jgi:serine/threonine-protein kinase
MLLMLGHWLTMSDSKNIPALSETMQFVPRKGSAGSTDTLPAGTPFGHYVIRRYIGGGGMGRVYLATDKALDRDVAIKVLPPQRSGDQGIVARFMNEARSAARLNHEHIAQVYFAGEESKIPFIAFEYVEGINVRTMVEEHDVFPLPQALNYLLQIAHALAHAATHSVVHRDVKPSNILITREGRAKLIDMGLARLLDTSEARGDLTASGVTLGTFDYISPEQARDPRNADIRSDIYSLGCTFFFMLAGRPPFPEGTVLQKLLQHQGDAPPDIRSFQPTIPAEVAFLIQKMMAKDPRQRFQTPATLIEALTDVARRLGLRPAGQGNLVWTATKSRRTSLLLQHFPWIAAVSLLFVGFFLTTLFSRQFHRTVPLPNLPESNLLTPPTTVEVSPVSPEPVRASPSFAVTFVSHSAAASAPPFSGLRLPMAGGSLQPALEGGEIGFLSSASSERLSVANLPRTSSPHATQRVNPSFQVRRCVDPTGTTPGAYISLASALTGAEDGTIIELRWNHTQRIAEPIRLDQRELQFVAAPGYNPILLFEPSGSQTARSFFAVFSSNLKFQEVGIEIRLHTNVLLPHWSLFELAGNTQLTFEKCCLTLRNHSTTDGTVHHDDVVFFRNGTPTSVEGTNNMGDTFFDPLTIAIKDSVLRGEAGAIQSNVPQDIHLSLTNSLVALAMPFIHVKESRRAVRRGMIQMDWEQVAFFGRQGVALLFKDAEPIMVNFISKQSMFVLHRSPFAIFSGARTQQGALEDFQWSGTENYLQGVSGLRFRASSLSPDLGMTYDIPLELWIDNASEQMTVDALRLSDINKPMSRYLPQDVRLFSDSPGSNTLPNFNWFPGRWNND